MTNENSINQNFITNQDLLNKIIKKSSLNQNNLIIDIGVGKGSISESLLKNKYKVLGFEIDKNLFDYTSNQLKNENLTLINQDFLAYNLKNLNTKFSVFSNIPFNQTTKIVQKLLIENQQAEEVCLIMQEEAANRFFGKKEGLLLSLIILNSYEAEVIHKFQKKDFTPIPKVNIVLVKFSKRESNLVSKDNYLKFLNFISYLVMQQKPSIIDRLSKVLNYYSLKDLLKNLSIEPFQTLYQIPKIKYFEIFDILLKKFPSKFEIFEGAYQNYKYINQKNKKSFQTRIK